MTARIITSAPPGWWAWHHQHGHLTATPVAAWIHDDDTWPVAAIVIPTTGALLALNDDIARHLHGQLLAVTGPGQPPPTIHTQPTPHPQLEPDEDNPRQTPPPPENEHPQQPSAQPEPADLDALAAKFGP
jgi:hypothetical protein